MSLVHVLEKLAVYRRRRANEEAGKLLVLCCSGVLEHRRGSQTSSPGQWHSSQRGRLNKGGLDKGRGRCFGYRERQCKGPEVSQHPLQPRLGGRQPAMLVGSGA